MLSPALGRGQKLQGRSLSLGFSRVSSHHRSTKVQGKHEAVPPACQQPLHAGWVREQRPGESTCCEQPGGAALLTAAAPSQQPGASPGHSDRQQPLHHGPQPHLQLSLPRQLPPAAQGSSSACILPLPAAANLVLLLCIAPANRTPADPGQGVSSWRAFTPRQQLLVLGWSCSAGCQDTSPTQSCADLHRAEQKLPLQ